MSTSATILLHFPAHLKTQSLVRSISTIGFTGEPVPNIPFSDELQEKLLVVLDEIFDSVTEDWLAAMLRIILSSEHADLQPSEALDIWADMHIDKCACQICEQYQ